MPFYLFLKGKALTFMIYERYLGSMEPSQYRAFKAPRDNTPRKGFTVTKGGEQIPHLNFLPNIYNQRMDAVAALQTYVASSAY